MEKFNFKEIKKEEYEALCRGINVPLTQQYFYGEWQVAADKKVLRYVMEADGRVVGFFQIIKYPTSFGRNYLYIPHGPVFLGDITDEFLAEFRKFCCDLLKKEDSVFFRFDPTWMSNLQVGGQFFLAPRFMYNGNFQPKYESILNLTLDEEEILAGMKKVNRYTVKQAEKLGVTVEIVGSNFLQYLDKFYELIEATSERDSFSHNAKEYYSKIFSSCERDKNAFMAIARFNDEIMLINFFVIYGDSAFFLFSGSENENRKVGYTYLAQWEAIRHAKKLGLKRYNFGAVIPEDNKYPFYKNWQGFSDFKKRFGGATLEYGDLYDVVNSKFWYGLYTLRKVVSLIKKKLFT